MNCSASGIWNDKDNLLPKYKQNADLWSINRNRLHVEWACYSHYFAGQKNDLIGICFL